MNIAVTRHQRSWLVAALLLTAGCAPIATQGPAPIAQVESVAGPGAVIRPAAGGQVGAQAGSLLYSGDGFATDDQSTMTMSVLVGDRGTLNVGPGTDPLLTDAACFTISLFSRGTIEAFGHNFCVDGPSGIVFIQNSDVVYHYAGPGDMVVTVKQGRVTILNRPGYFAITGQTFEVRNGRITGMSFQREVPPAPPPVYVPPPAPPRIYRPPPNHVPVRKKPPPISPKPPVTPPQQPVIG